VSALRYWPLSAFTTLLALVLLGALAVWAVARARTGAALPGLVIATAALALIGVLGASVFAMRPGFLTVPVSPAASGEGRGDIGVAEAHLNDLVDAGAPPGLTALVVKDGELVYASGFGLADGPGGVPATPDTVYRWWSITKVFTAVAVMQLAEKGKLSLDDPVSDHVRGFSPTLAGEAIPGITIRELLSHSSGLPDAGNEILGWLHFEPEAALDQTGLVNATMPRYSRLAAAPGAEGRYSNIGYMILSAVVEAASGQRYEDYVVANILEPLGMVRTGFEFPGVPVEQIAVGSHPLDAMVLPASLAIDLDRAVRERSGNRLWFNPVYPDQTGPSGLVGPASDMARFMLAMLAGGELDGVRIVSEESIRIMVTPVVAAKVSPAPRDGFEFGLGWFIHEGERGTSLSHGGQGMGMSSLMTLFPDERLGILVVGNSTYLGRDFGAGAVAALTEVDWSRAADGTRD
jgi:CubicO group peptidase (beta-lactamase class C family)